VALRTRRGRWCVLWIAASIGCSSARAPLSAPPPMMANPGSIPTASQSGNLSAPLWTPWRSGQVNAANAATAKAAQSVLEDDPLSLRHMPSQLGPEVHVRAARVFETRNRFDEALESYGKALESQPTDLGAIVGIARLHDRLGHFDESNRWYQHAVALHPSVAAVHNDFGLCLARQGNLPRAIEVMQQAVRLDPRQALYRNNIAKMLVQGGRVDESLEHLVAVFPPAAAHYNLGCLLDDVGQTDVAALAFRRSLEIDPAFSRAGQALAARSLPAPAGPPTESSPAIPPRIAANGATPAFPTPSAAPPAPQAPAQGPSSVMPTWPGAPGPTRLPPPSAPTPVQGPSITNGDPTQTTPSAAGWSPSPQVPPGGPSPSVSRYSQP